MDGKFCFIGAGNMARAIAKGLLERGLLRGTQMWAASPGGALALADLPGVTCTTDNAAAARDAAIVVLAVKPHLVQAACDSIAAAVPGDALIISVAAGTALSQLRAWLPTELNSVRRIVRVMPNTPCSIGVGASAACFGNTLPADEACVRAIFGAVGILEAVTEPQLDAVTGLSGSGPAFVFLFIEALADGGVAAGLPRATAQALALQTVRGAAMLCQSTGQHPAQLKDAVASPGGTTITGIHALETAGFRGAVMSAVMAASKRCAELRR